MTTDTGAEAPTADGFHWGGTAISLAPHMNVDADRRNRWVNVIAVAGQVYPPGTYMLPTVLLMTAPPGDPARWETEVRRTMEGRILFKTYLSPGDANTIRALEIANELGVPAIVFFEANERPQFIEALKLPNIRTRVALVNDPVTDGVMVITAVTDVLQGLRDQSNAKRAAR